MQKHFLALSKISLLLRPLAVGKVSAATPIDDSVIPTYMHDFAKGLGSKKASDLYAPVRQFVDATVRYRGLAKNTARLHLLFALSKLYQVRKTLLAAA